jgi:hypothetical protein
MPSMPVAAKKVRPKLKKPPVQRAPRKRQLIPVPAAPFPVAKQKVEPNADDR